MAKIRLSLQHGDYTMAQTLIAEAKEFVLECKYNLFVLLLVVYFYL